MSDRSDSLFWHKKGEDCQTHTKITFYFKQITRFLRAIRSNHEQITGVALFKEIESLSLKVALL